FGTEEPDELAGSLKTSTGAPQGDDEDVPSRERGRFLRVVVPRDLYARLLAVAPALGVRPSDLARVALARLIARWHGQLLPAARSPRSAAARRRRALGADAAGIPRDEWAVARLFLSEELAGALEAFLAMQITAAQAAPPRRR